MAGFWYFWLHCGTLFSVSVCLFALDGGMVCGDKDGLLSKMSRDVDTLSECVLSCTALTYGIMLKRQDTRTVRFKISAAGEHGEFCWATKIKCRSGERFLHAYIVLPVDKSVVEGDTLRLQTTSPTYKDTLRPHDGHTLLSDGCGLHFDVSSHLNAGGKQPTFCVQIVPQQRTLGDGLMCPPFLVTTWQSQNLSPTNQGGG